MGVSLTFEQLRDTLTDLQGATDVPGEVRADVEACAEALSTLPTIDREVLAALISQHPDWVPVLGACVRLSREQLQNQLRSRIGSSAWTKLAKSDPMRIVTALDEGFGLVDAVQEQRTRHWTFADILVERYGSRSRATSSIRRGRALEDQVESVVAALGLPHEMRTRFVGRGAATAPCDIAIPAGGSGALVVGSAKGFNSTGSKLTDAVREIEEMASVRLPRQFVFAFVDGIGWLRRENDLRRIYALWVRQEIDGLYTLARMNDFQNDLRAVAARLSLL